MSDEPFSRLNDLTESLDDLRLLRLDDAEFHPIIEGLQAEINQSQERARISNQDGDYRANSAESSGWVSSGHHASFGATGQPEPETLFYGMPITGVRPILPPLDSFQWAEHEYATQAPGIPPGILLDKLIPPLCPPPPDGFSYPQAPPFTLAHDRRYRRGVTYFSDFRVADKPLLRQRLLCTINPPNIDPKLHGGDYIAEPLAGMIQMPLSVPFIQRLDGDPLNTVTCAVAHSSASLEIFGIEPEVQKLEQELYMLAFGSNPKKTDQTSIRALCSLGLKPNDRSAKNLGKESRTGSSSLGSTVGKGEGRGVFLPAVQTATPEASLLIGDALKIIHKLQQLIMPCSLSKFEYEMTKWYMTENNVFVSGGLGPGATSVQQNVSAGQGNLAEKIGFVQGKWHTDESDAHVYFTFGILMLKLPPGSDPGPFMFGRCGLYVRETGVLILYLVFRGNDLHSGYSPTYDGARLKEWLDLEALEALVDLISPENRIFFVAYPSEVGMSRVAAVSVVPPVFFMNQGAPVSHKLRQKNFAQHGATVLGDAHARANRLGREIWWGAFNAFKVAGLTLDLTPDELFARTKYHNEDNETRALDVPPIDIDRDAKTVQTMRGYFAWYKIQSEKYLIRISRSAYQTIQAALRLRRLTKQNSFPVTERRGVWLDVPRFTGASTHRITRVLKRAQVNGQMCWTVNIESQSEPMTVAEDDTPWLHEHRNSALIANFLGSNIPLTSPYLRNFYQTMVENSTAATTRPPTELVASSGEIIPLESTNVTPIVNESHLDFFSTNNGDPSLVDPREPPAGSKDGARPIPPNLDGDDVPMPEPTNDTETPTSDSFVSGNGDPSLVNSGRVIAASGERAPSMASTPNLSGPEVNMRDSTNGNSPSDRGVNNGSGERALSLEPSGSGADVSMTKAYDFVGAGSEIESEDEVFEAPRIVRSRPANEGSAQWLVRGQGFDGKTWLTAAEIVEIAPDLQLSVSSPAAKKRRREDNSSGSETDDLSSDDDYGKKKGPVKRLPKPVPDLGPLRAEDLGAHALSTISSLLSSTNLAAELEALKSDREGVSTLKGKKIVLPDLVQKLLDSNGTNNVISSLLKFGQPDERTAIALVTRLMSTVDSIPELARAKEQLGIVGRMVQWDLCRAHLILYEWFQNTGPHLTKNLVLLHNRSVDDLESQFPAFAPLVKCVVDYAKQIQASSLVHRKKKRKQEKTIESAPPLPAFPPPSEVPSHLYGLIPNPRKSGTVKLPPITQVKEGDSELVNAAVQCLFDLLSREMVVIPMAPFDEHWMSPQRRVALSKAQAKAVTGVSKKTVKKKGHSLADELQKVQARMIARGAVLHCISQVCGGESIFASQAMHEVLLCPTSLFPSRWHEDTRFMAAILRDETTTLATLTIPLQSMLSSNPGVTHNAAELAAFVHRRMLELHRGRPISEEEFLNPDMVVENGTSLAAPAAKEPRQKHIPRIDLTPAQLLGPGLRSIDETTESKPLLAKLALIVREALNERQNLGPCNSSLRWILEGRHPGTGAASLNRDLTDPVRMFSVNAELLKEKIPPNRATGALGLSNLLAWQLTGQGGGTRIFLDTQDTMFFESVDQCLQVFGDAHSHNMDMMEAYQELHPDATDKVVDAAVKRQPGYIPTHNTNAYGEATNFLGITPTHTKDKQKWTLEEKFKPLYESNVQQRWAEFLGDMSGQDPETFTGKKKNWKEALDFIQEFGFYGLRSDGLTTLQLANNLVVLGICEEPDPESMAAWISGRGELGAFKGLKLLGFNLNASDPLATRTAFICVHDHLAKHLSREAKALLGFGVIFVEHTLCKVKRWTGIYDTAMRQSSFQSLADELIHRLPGAPRPNECLPFPIEVTIEELRMAIEKAKVFIIFIIGVYMLILYIQV